MKLIRSNLFNSLVNFINYNSLSINKKLISNKVLKKNLNKYILLTKYRELFTTETEINIYYNRFFWYSKLMKEYINIYGEDDLNMEQERFKLLEEGERLPNIDWNIIEKIVRDLDKNDG